MLARARQIRHRYMIMHGPMSPAAVGIGEFQQVEPIPLEPTGNFLNSVGGYQSTFVGTTTQVLPLKRC